MKITKEYLKEIIKEELQKLTETYKIGQKVTVKKSGKQTTDKVGIIVALPVENPKGEDDLLRFPLVKIGSNKIRIDPKNFVK
jgi:hypothetical protein